MPYGVGSDAIKQALNPRGGLDVNAGTYGAFGEINVSQFRPQTGWTFPYIINPAIVTTTELNGGTVTQEGSFAKIETGTDPNGVAFVRSNRALTYSPGLGAVARFTAIFNDPTPNTQQLIGVINNEDGFAFGYDGLLFGVLRRRGGVDTWIYQDQWSENKTGQWDYLNPQKLNVYQIKFQWLGGGMQYFYIEGESGNFETVHEIKYANLNDNVSVENPSLPLSAGVANLGNATNITLRTPSAVAGLEGEPFSPVFEALVAYERIVTIPANVETYLFGLQNPTNWQGKDNRLYVLPRLFTFATDGAKPFIVRVYFNPTITTPVWTDVEPGISPLQYDEAGTWVPNGEAKVFTYALGKADNAAIDLSVIDAEIQPRQIYAITAFTPNVGGDMVVGINFKSRT